MQKVRNFKERAVRVAGNKRQIDIARDLIKDVMYQNAGQAVTLFGGYNQPAYRPPRGPGGPPQWASRGPHSPYSRPYDYHYRGPYSSQGQHMPPRGRYGAGWDQIPPHSGPYSYYDRQGAQTSGLLPHPSGYAPSPVLGGPPSSQAYMQMYEQLKYDSNPPPVQPPFGGSYPPVGGGQPKLFPSAAT